MTKKDFLETIKDCDDDSIIMVQSPTFNMQIGICNLKIITNTDVMTGIKTTSIIVK